MPMGGCPGETMPPPIKPQGGCPGKTTPPETQSYQAPWEKDWPIESVAYVRVDPKPWEDLENDESVSEYTYIYEDRIVHIWESNVYDYDGQDEEDEIARARIIWERLKPSADWFYCHTDGTRICDGEVIPHHAHIIIGLRDEVDPNWWHKAMSESVSPPTHWLEDEPEIDSVTNPKPAQPDCLASARLDQPEATAQVCGGEDAIQTENSNITQGKSASCTADVELRAELSKLHNAIPNTLCAIITFERQSVQMFFSPENAIADFERKVKNLWNIPRKMYYLLINGKHESHLNPKWPIRTAVCVKIKGLLGGDPRELTIWINNEKMCCTTDHTILKLLETRNQKVEGECLYAENGLRVELNERIGAYFMPESETRLRWPQADIGNQNDLLKVHLKCAKENKIFEIALRNDVTFEDVMGLTFDLFGTPDDIKLFQNGFQLDLADSVKEWMSSTGSKAQITIHPDITFESTDEIEKIPVMEINYNGTPRWFRKSRDWREKITEAFELGNMSWSLDKDNQEWEEGTFALREMARTSMPADHTPPPTPDMSPLNSDHDDTGSTTLTNPDPPAAPKEVENSPEISAATIAVLSIDWETGPTEIATGNEQIIPPNPPIPVTSDDSLQEMEPDSTSSEELSDRESRDETTHEIVNSAENGQPTPTNLTTESPQESKPFPKVDHELREGLMTIKSDWAIVHFKKGEEMKEIFDFLFHPVENKWRLQGSIEAFTSLTWSEGIFWFEEDGRKSCKRSFKELSKRNLSVFPGRSPARLDSPNPLCTPVVTEWQPSNHISIHTDTEPPSLIEPNLTLSTLPPPQIEPQDPPTSKPVSTPLVKPSLKSPPSLSTVESEKSAKPKGPVFTLIKDGVSKEFPAARRRIGERKNFVKKHFGEGRFKYFDKIEKKEIDLGNCIAGRTYEIRTVKDQPANNPTSSPGKNVTFLTEFGRHPNMKIFDTDSEARRTAIMRGMVVHGAHKLLLEGREITWADMKNGDTIKVERITDASVYVFTDKSQVCAEDATEVKYLQSDPESAVKIVQFLWPGRTLFRKFERAPPNTWVPFESLWILPKESWHRWMKFEGRQREIAFTSEEHFFRQAENWVNGRVNIVNDEGNEVFLKDTEDDQCYNLVKDAYGKTISFRWDGLLMNAEYDGTNARFWRNVKKLVNPPEKLVLLQNGRIVSPDKAQSKFTYQLARIKNDKILREVEFVRGEETIGVDLSEEDALQAITQTWGVANWRIVDGFGTPFATNNLRDGTRYIALKDGEILSKRDPNRSYSTFTVNKVSDEVRFIAKCGNQTERICMLPFSRNKLIEICKSIWGPGYYKWNEEDVKNLHGRTLSIQKLPMKDDGSKIISYKIAYADEPGKYQSIEMKSKCGVQVYDIEKILRCRLFGRDLYLETKDPHSRSEWEGKTIRVGWRTWRHVQRRHMAPKP
jgi:hypothetical protein